VFFTFYGGKRRISPRYPKPTHKKIVEPFAGSAGYSLLHCDADVTLVEKDAALAGIWRYLIAVRPAEIRRLPRLPESGALSDAKWPCEEAKNLAGFWIGRGLSRPNKSASAWMRDPRYIRWSWGENCIERIASQVGKIKHWKLIEGDYTKAPGIAATWFIDPPYIKAGTYYRESCRNIDFEALGEWCKKREGQVMVCEQDGATWLPFKPFYKAKANESAYGGKVSAEVIWQPKPDRRLGKKGEQHGHI